MTQTEGQRRPGPVVSVYFTPSGSVRYWSKVLNNKGFPIDPIADCGPKGGARTDPAANAAEISYTLVLSPHTRSPKLLKTLGISCRVWFLQQNQLELCGGELLRVIVLATDGEGD